MGFFQEPTNWVFLSFVIFAVGFAYKGWSHVLARLDGRIAEISAELETAAKLHREAADMLAQYQTRQREALSEADTITARAREQAESIRIRAEYDLKETIARRERQLEERLARIEQSAIAELRAAAASIALEASESLIRKGLDAKGQIALVDKSTASITTSGIN